VEVLNGLSLAVHRGDRIAFVGGDGLARTTLFQILAGEMASDGGSFRWGPTITPAYFPKDNGAYFRNEMNLVDWICQFPPCDSESFARGFLGRMLFSGDEAVKRVSVLSGGEKVRCMLARMMLREANVLILDEPTSHLDLESLTALNNGLIAFPGVLLLASQDHQLVSTLANRIVEITPAGVVDQVMGFEEYLGNSPTAITC
jgi:ATPase subunit of ABC transporter with duplicated ATPase domains